MASTIKSMTLRSSINSRFSSGNNKKKTSIARIEPTWVIVSIEQISFVRSKQAHRCRVTTDVTFHREWPQRRTRRLHQLHISIMSSHGKADIFKTTLLWNDLTVGFYKENTIPWPPDLISMTEYKIQLTYKGKFTHAATARGTVSCPRCLHRDKTTGCRVFKIGECFYKEIWHNMTTTVIQKVFMRIIQSETLSYFYITTWSHKYCTALNMWKCTHPITFIRNQHEEVMQLNSTNILN